MRKCYDILNDTDLNYPASFPEKSSSTKYVFIAHKNTSLMFSYKQMNVLRLLLLRFSPLPRLLFSTLSLPLLTQWFQ